MNNVDELNLLKNNVIKFKFKCVYVNVVPKKNRLKLIMLHRQQVEEACHLIKTAYEHESGQYIKIIDTESSFDKQVQDVFDSPLSQTQTLVKKAYFKELQ